MIQKRVVSTGLDDLQQYILDDVSNIVSVQQGATVTSILDGRGPNDIIAIVQGGSPVFPLPDQISSNAAFTDGAGNVLGREFYEPFGASTTSGTVSLFGFTGQLQINSGLYYYRARFYDSNTGRFLSEDPTGLLSGDTDFYRYAGNNPAAVTDPAGTGEGWAGPFADLAGDTAGKAVGGEAPSGLAWTFLGNQLGSLAGAGAEAAVAAAAPSWAAGAAVGLEAAPEFAVVVPFLIEAAAPVAAFAAAAFVAGALSEAFTEYVCKGELDLGKVGRAGVVGVFTAAGGKFIPGAVGKALTSAAGAWVSGRLDKLDAEQQ